MSFALRGAPCGDDATLGQALRGYHGQVPTPDVTPDRDEPRFLDGAPLVEPADGETVS
jgi:hypothetical protein